MTAELMRGAPVAAALDERTSARAAELAARGVTPALAIVRVGERPDDLSYERGALRRCERVGVAARTLALPDACGQEELLAALRELSLDASVHGILLLRPLPAGLDEDAARAEVAPEKDVDCASDASLLGVLSGRPVGFAPCTAEAVVRILDHYGVALEGARACVVGRSLVIGRPVAALLTARDATVTLCHTRTRDLAGECRRVDVVVAAAGRAGVVGADALRPGQVVVDVGINWDEKAGRLVGDVDPASADVVGKITPVPGGVGAVTTAVLAAHVVEAAERSVRA